MSSHLTVIRDEFPVLPDGLEVGDRLELRVTGIVRRIEGDLIDVSDAGGRAHVIGGTEHELLLERIDVLTA